MYDFYLGTILLPVPPSSLSLKVGGQNKTYTTINDGEINVLKSPKLTDIELKVLLPNQEYAFAKYKSGFQDADTYLSALEKLKTDCKPFQFIVTRALPNGKKLFNTNIKVSLENYSISEDAKEVFDVTVSIKLKQYKDYGTKKAVLTVINDTATAKAEIPRSAENSPGSNLPITYAIVGGDCLSNIAKRFYGDGSKYGVIASANNISNPNLIRAGKNITIPAL